MSENKILIAAAGAGKTSFIIDSALEDASKSVLITTYTRTNANEIREKIKAKYKTISGKEIIPNNIKVEEWFTFLLTHGVRPFKSVIDKNLTYMPVGFNLTTTKSGLKTTYTNKSNQIERIYWGEEENLFRHYFTKDFRIHSDKISKFVFKCNHKTDNGFCKRLSSNFDTIYIDEIQDLAGWDLEILRLLFSSELITVLVGDPRQTVYLTNLAQKHTQYRSGNIVDFINMECKKLGVKIDFDTLNKTHRNNKEIALFSSMLYPVFPPTECCTCLEHQNESALYKGVYMIRPSDIEKLKSELSGLELKVLKFKNSLDDEMNIGVSKGLTFERVLISPTESIIEWLKGNDSLADSTRAKFYVALTRAKFSSFIVYDYLDGEHFIDGVELFDKKLVQPTLPF